MSLDNIQLSPIVLQQLFKNSLTDLKNNQHSNEKEPAKTLAVLGNNKKHILIIISNDDTLYLPDDQLNFLLLLFHHESYHTPFTFFISTLSSIFLLKIQYLNPN